ncbi:T9SS type A sorting domain-containing protein [Flavobacterium sp. CYK-4]|uniref:T9SS type A sorting domain-containing protein n=1 Tax=Flavobacterium lotistagni TaxID=2709660 RepID=UPI001408F419|nr:T9SS type A sorting domain-containing protein [Flavobacterium lotistagni]NHM06668.1 T9SS type A sorting domain-containing protein [Flavobacterium lotistagni]
MKKTILALATLWMGNLLINAQGFAPTATQWNIPAVTDYYEFRLSYDDHVVIDMNGDGKPDLVDTENQATESVSDVFVSGSQKYWKVYLNVGGSFSTTATQWNIPAVSDFYEFRLSYNEHMVIDMNGDNLPDFVDTENQATEQVSDVFLNGGQKYWKVYLNTGSGFSPTATQWNIPAVSDFYEFRLSYDEHVVIDMNGDGKPDFVDTENQATESTSDVFVNGSQKYWKVYLNTGSGFSPTATQWNIPAVSDFYEFRLSYDYHVVIDINGDDLPDFVDTENQSTEQTSDVFLNGGQKYWKVYLNTGSGFNPTATQWNIPVVSDFYEFRLSYDDHVVIDLNGDKKPDFIDTENQATEFSSDVFLSGSQKYWKAYLNTGSGFSPTATQWNIPAVSDFYEFRLSYDDHVVIDMNGDRTPDFVDTENQSTEQISDVFLNGGQKYWKVYLNTLSGLANNTFELVGNDVVVYPNPVTDSFKISHPEAIQAIDIYDLKGAMVKTVSTDFQQAIDVSDLPQGLYLLRVKPISGDVSFAKVVKK